MNSSPKLSTFSTTSSPSSSTPSIPSSISSSPDYSPDLGAILTAPPSSSLEPSSPTIDPSFQSCRSSDYFDQTSEHTAASPVKAPAVAIIAPVNSITPPITPDLTADLQRAESLGDSCPGTLFLPVPVDVQDLGNGHLEDNPALQSIGLPSATPDQSTRASSVTDKPRKHRNRISSFFLRFTNKRSSAAYLQPQQQQKQQQQEQQHNRHEGLTNNPLNSSDKNSVAAAAADHSTGCDYSGSDYLPRDEFGDRGSCARQLSTLQNVVLHAPSAPFRYNPSRSPSLSSFNTTRSNSYRPRSLRKLGSRRSSNASQLTLSSLSDHQHKTPVIYRSTAACRLSVPVEALRDLQTISEHDITRKMHQTSSRLLRMTEDERPYTRDFKDLFSTLMVSLPLTPHRVRFQRIDHTFTSEEAITNLGSLKFSQSNRMPDPKDPSRIVTTTTTTTFSMAREMAKSVCQKFLEARFVESVDGKNDFSSKSAVWQLTPKGMHILQRFCSRNGINQRHVQMVLDSPRNTMHLVLLEREAEGDRIHRDQATIEVVFRRFVGQDGPNLKWSTANSDSDSVTDYQTGLIGVKMARERKVGDKTYWNTFTGRAAVDWLMDCCTMVDRRETIEVAGLFVEAGLIHPVEGTVLPGKFSANKSSIYFVTDRGQRVAGWIPSNTKTAVVGNDANLSRKTEGTNRDSNANRMTIIIKDPALRLLFREFLRDTHCEENLAFYLDVKEFLSTYHHAKKDATSSLRLDTIRETLAAAYSLYNAFLAPGSPCELNIDHSLRTALAARMTRAVGDDEATIASLDEVAGLFDQAQTSVFKLMASDSVPKFMREPKYVPIIRERNLDVVIGGLNAAATPRA